MGKFNYTILVFIIFTNSAFSQNTYKYNKETNVVYDWEAKFNFHYFSTYDYDLKMFTDRMEVPSILVIDIDSDGTGRAITYVADKNILRIDKCIKHEKYFEFFLSNPKGVKMKSFLWIKDGTVTEYEVQHPFEKTSYIVY